MSEQDYQEGYTAGFAAGYVQGSQQTRLSLTGSRRQVTTRRSSRTTPKPQRRSGKKDPKMAAALRKANQLGRTKAGKLRKGYTQAKIMKKAHQLRRRM